MSYIPKLYDSVAARRKQKQGRGDLIVGPVFEVSETSCTIVTNGQYRFELMFDQWKFQFLFNNGNPYEDTDLTKM